MKRKWIKLGDLPLPIAKKSGWPWTEESSALPERMFDGSEWPKISIITPSFNQAAFIEETIRSVLLQNYPNLEYIVIDGASKDGSIEIIRQYAPYLDVFISEPDKGHADALNKGMQRATGTILAFINSDDFYLPGALAAVAEEFQRNGEAGLVYGKCHFVDENSRQTGEHLGNVLTLEEILDFWNVWCAKRQIVQPEAFWRRAIFEKTGPFNTNIYMLFDYEYWCRMLMAGAVFHSFDRAVSCFRFQRAQKSQNANDKTGGEYLAMARPWLWDHSISMPAFRRKALQGEWLYHGKLIPAVARSVQRHEGKLVRWLKLASLLLRYPQILCAHAFRQRLRSIIKLAP